MTITLEKLNEIFSKAFDCEISLNVETKKEDLDQWDSMNHLFLITELSENLGVSFTQDEIEKIRSVEMLIEILKKK
jgi:acyl carrier protein